MGYTLQIGEARIEYDPDVVSIDCVVFRRDDAPAFGDPTDNTSARWPSYTAWHESMEALDMCELMFRKRNARGEYEEGGFEWKGTHRFPLISAHPGAMPITREHVEYAEAKLAAYKAKHPTHVARYQQLKPSAVPLVPDMPMYGADQYESDPRNDDNLCRGEWLVWWLRWALENCTQPVFVNS